jgi:hypothetical protein
MKRYVSFIFGTTIICLPLPLLPKHPILYALAFFSMLVLIVIVLTVCTGFIRIAKK